MKNLFLALLIGFSAQSFGDFETGGIDTVLRTPHAGGRAKFGAIDVSKSAAVTGLLAPVNGGTGQDLHASTGAISVSSGTVSAGTLGITNGGTGQITAQAAVDALLPTQTSNSGKFLTTNATTSSWGIPQPTISYVSQSSTLNPAVISTWYVLSGASFVVTLPDASTSGYAGKQIIFLHNGTSLTQTYTITPASGQSIGTLSANATFVMYTNQEKLTLFSDGANWQVLNHFTNTGFVAAGGNTINGTTSDPTKASGITVDEIYWQRSGNTANIRIEYVQSNTTSAATGSGDYLWQLPANMTANTANITLFTTVIGGTANASITNNIGTGSIRLNTANGPIMVSLYDSTHVRFYAITQAPSGGMISSTAGWSLTTASFSATASFSVQIQGWQP